MRAILNLSGKFSLGGKRTHYRKLTTDSGSAQIKQPTRVIRNLTDGFDSRR